MIEICQIEEYLCDIDDNNEIQQEIKDKPWR